jgi:2-keto-4-pentenoate hydratase/2-oxohepta-3-ene-1,7-dioic acid hydratase in catechol pathway
MKWLRFDLRGTSAFGVLDGDVVHVHRGDMFEAPLATGETVPLAEIVWRPPCQPTKMLALWNNFRAAATKNGWAEPAEPLYFVKTPNSFAAHGSTVPVPAAYGGRVVFEGELAIVIGRRARAVPLADAAAHIFGYTCADDITAVELLARDPAFPQWTRAKGFDGFGVFGPVIETDFDPAAASVVTRVGGRERQNYALSDMFFSPAELVSRISQDLTLEPGDVILCGTSLGVLPMKAGSEVEVQIEGIGSLKHLYG